MNLLENKLKELERENNETFFDLKNFDNRDLLKEMVDYVAGSSLSPFQVQVIYKDFLGMALEAEQEEITLKEKLGVSPKEFCDDIIENAGENKRYEQIIQIFVNVLQALAIYQTVVWLILEGRPEKYGVSLGGIIIYFAGMGFCGWLERIVKKKTVLKENKFLKAMPMLIYFLFFVIVFSIAYKQPEMFRYYIITGKGWVITLVLDSIAVVATLLWNYYWEIRVKEYL